MPAELRHRDPEGAKTTVAVLEAILERAPAGLASPTRQRLVDLAGNAPTFVARARETVFADVGAPMALGERGLDVIGTLGEGGMGVVRLAVQRSLGREVAAKTLKPGERTRDAQIQLAREALVTGKLEHPNIVPVHDVTMEPDGTPIVVLKRIEGRSWSDVLAAPEDVDERLLRRDPLAYHLGVLRSVCQALELAHERRIIHRDLKPDNVMIGRHGEVYVVDWGVAATLDPDADPRLPRVDDQVVGTPAYMAPEVLLGSAADIGVCTDVYLVGAVLYELVAGRPPHMGTRFEDLFESVFVGPPPLPDNTAGDLAAIVSRAMAVMPDARFPSIAELRAALEDHLGHRTSVALAKEAERKLEALLAHISARGAGEREAAQQAFGECRFGFQHALSTWEANTSARRGLDRALAAMAELELDAGRTDAAMALLAEAHDVPEALRVRAEEAARRAADERAVLDELERRRNELDPRVGHRQRVLFGMFACGSWALTPLVPIVRVYGRGIPQQPWELRTWPFVMGACYALVAFLLRRSLLATALNRRVMGTVVATMIGFGLFHTGALRLGLSIDAIHGLDLFYYGLAAAVMAAWGDARFLASTALYFTLFFSDMARPELRYYAFLIGNFGLVLNVLWMWPPWRPASAEPAAAVRGSQVSMD